MPAILGIGGIIHCLDISALGCAPFADISPIRSASVPDIVFRALLHLISLNLIPTCRRKYVYSHCTGEEEWIAA